MQNPVGFEAGELLESLDQSGEDESSDDEKGAADGEEAPLRNATDFFIVELLPIGSGWIEPAEEPMGESEVHHGRETEGSEEEKSGRPEELLEFRLFFIGGNRFVDARVVEEAFVVDEGIKERALAIVREQEKGS